MATYVRTCMRVGYERAESAGCACGLRPEVACGTQGEAGRIHTIHMPLVRLPKRTSVRRCADALMYVRRASTSACVPYTRADADAGAARRSACHSAITYFRPGAKRVARATGVLCD